MNICTKAIIMYGNITSCIRASFSSTYTPPQVDKYRCENGGAREIGKRRLPTANVAQLVWSRPIYGADQDKNGKPKPDKTKPDKTKRENDKGLKKTKPPKRDGLASIL